MLENVLKYHSGRSRLEALFGSFAVVFSIAVVLLAAVRFLEAASLSVFVLGGLLLCTIFMVSARVFERANFSVANSEKAKLALGMLLCLVVILAI